MTDSGFFALISRMKYIGRWGLMRNAIPENVQEHSHEVAVFAHALGVISRDVLGKECDVNALVTQALYHDASEIFTGDLPTPIKYHNKAITNAYHEVEHLAVEKLIAMLPDEMQGAYREAMTESPLVKAADKLSAYVKCIAERRAGNDEFRAAERQTRAALERMALPEVDYFLEYFVPAFEKSLDEFEAVKEF